MAAPPVKVPPGPVAVARSTAATEMPLPTALWPNALPAVLSAAVMRPRWVSRRNARAAPL